MKPWLKAGLIGGAILIGLAALNLAPAFGVCCCLAWPLACLGTGALAGFFVPPVRDGGTAAGQGALAATLAQLLGGIVNAAIVTLQSATMDVSQAASDLITAWRDVGLDTTILENALDSMPPWLAGESGGLISGLVSGGVCLIGGLVVAAVLGAVGGLIFASAKRE